MSLKSEASMDEHSIGNILLDAEVVTADAVIAGLEHAEANGTRLGEALVSLRLVSPETVDAALVHQKAVRAVSVREKTHETATLVGLTTQGLAAVTERLDGLFATADEIVRAFPQRRATRRPG